MENDTVALGFSDEELRRAALLVSAAMGDFCSALEDEEYEFSDGFRAKMDALIKKQRFKDSAANALRGVASTAAVLALCAGIWLGTDTGARADFQQWIMTKYENSFIYKFYDKASLQTVKCIEFGWLPEGCEKIEEEINENGGYFYFIADGGRGFILHYTVMSSNENSAITGENVEHEVVEVNGQTADYFDDLDANNPDVLWWTDEKSGIAFDLNAILEKGEMIKIAENIKLVFE